MLFPENNTDFIIVTDYDADVKLYPNFLTSVESKTIQTHVYQQIKLENEQVFMFGKLYVLDRKVAWVAENGLSYGYNTKRWQPQPWTTPLQVIKEKIEQLVGATFNSCLINYYPNGSDGMGYHQDNETELGTNPIIASLSLGAARKFSLKHIEDKTTIQTTLPDGSLLVMGGACQHNWKHALPKTKKVTEARINLTFRAII